MTKRIRFACAALAVAAAGCASGSAQPAPSDAAVLSDGRDVLSAAYGAGESQFGELYLPADSASPVPVIVLIHGGFWTAAYGLDLMRPLAKDLSVRGYAVWNIEYRRIGEPDAAYPATFEDVSQAIDELATLADDHRLDLDRVALVGHSAGGHLALWAAGRPNQAVPAAVAVGLGPVVDLAAGARAGLGGGAIVALLGGTPEQQGERYARATPTTATDTRLVVIRGSSDSIVPAPFTVPVVGADRIEVTDIVGDDHFDLIDPSSASWAAVIDVLAMM